jgi:hypothetical protein
VEADSWEEPHNVVSATLVEPLPALEGCNRLPFGAQMVLAPEVATASTPTGLEVKVHVPQDVALNPSGLAESTLRDTTVTLPEGLILNPSGADGLQACTEAQVGFTGVEAGADVFTPGLPSPFCPDAAKVGTVTITTPLLPNPLKGAVYLGSPAPEGETGRNPFGSLIAIYIVAEDPVSGVLVKLPGEVIPDPTTGRLVASFEHTPQLPFEDLTVHFFGGARAPLSTPAYCRSYTTATSFTPWSGGAPVNPTSSFAITSGANGSPCADPLPFSPTMTAGSTNLQAGTFAPFTMTMSREDGNRNLAGIAVHMPPGLLGRLSSVTPCPEPQAAEGSCGPQSLIGHTLTSVGLGPDPYAVAGTVFITGPYKGAPYGLSIVTPAVAGPFDLGSVVVRARITVDPYTSALTVTSEPLPTILHGIPLQIKHVNVTVDRPGFTFNPTNCSHLSISATISGERGATAPVSVPFEVANCATLPFKPKLTALTLARTSKVGGAALHVKVVSGAGQANIAQVRVLLPKVLPSRLSTLQKACLAATFNANPGSCPAGSVVGTATAVTPVLPQPLTGPAYLVSHGGAEFPDLVIVLQGDGVTLDLVGNTDIKHGITSSTFETVPDAPISTFDLVLPEGPHSALGATANLCRTNLTMPTTITGQNGAVIRQTTRIAVSGCRAHNARRARSTERHHARRTRGK